MSDLSGRWLGQYRLEAIIGRGSTATVYRAYQQSLGRHVAVKLLQPFLDPLVGARFRREAQAIAQLAHPNILPIFDYGEEDGRLYFVTQLIPGGTNLGHQLDGHPMEVGPALTLTGYMLDALGYAHSRGVVHRDVKPANILLPAPAWPLLADFGIARLADETTQLTPPGTLIGTAAYLAPERAQNKGADARSDLYSLGVVLYELLTGRLPFEGPTPAIVLQQHVYDAPPPPRTFNGAITPALERALLRALEKDPDRRYQSAEEMTAALVAASQGGKGAAAPPPAPLPPPDPYRTIQLPETGGPAPAPAPRQRRGVATTIALALIALLALGSALWLMRQPGATAARPPGSAQQRGTPAAAPDASPTTEPPSPLPSTSPTTEPPSPLPSASPVPATAPPAPSATAPIAQPTALPAPAEPVAGVVLLDDDAWVGGFGGAERRRSYAGRSAVWIYGQGTGYDSMRAGFTLGRQPTGVATLTVEGMDAEGRPRSRIAIRVNGTLIFEGPNPLPDDDLPLESGTWATESWQFDAALLRPGTNEISISNLSPGQFSLPPFFMLDYAELALAE